MSNDNVEQYLKKVTKIIYDSKKRSDVRQELSDTIEDFVEEYVAQGMNEADAREAALEQMGNPEEIGKLFNQIYHVKYEWKMLLYTLIWHTISYFILASLPFIYEGVGEFRQELTPLFVIVGGVLIVIGFFDSIAEKWMDLPFFYAYANNWNGGFLSNSGMICGIGTGILFPDIYKSFLAFLIVGISIMLQRSYMTEKRNQKEQKYLWELAIAKEDFEYKGHVFIGDEEIKVQAKKGIKVKKGEHLIVVGMAGFTLIVDAI